jgi:hypothetical protein
MNQITEIFNLGNELLTRIKAKTITQDEFDKTIRVMDSQIKTMNVVTNIYAIASKNKRAMKELADMNIIDTHTAIALSPPEHDLIKCDIKQRLIERGACLDYSGTHYEDCANCRHFAITRESILGKKEEKEI